MCLFNVLGIHCHTFNGICRWTTIINPKSHYETPIILNYPYLGLVHWKCKNCNHPVILSHNYLPPYGVDNSCSLYVQPLPPIEWWYYWNRCLDDIEMLFVRRFIVKMWQQYLIRRISHRNCRWAPERNVLIRDHIQSLFCSNGYRMGYRESSWIKLHRIFWLDHTHPLHCASQPSLNSSCRRTLMERKPYQNLKKSNRNFTRKCHSSLYEKTNKGLIMATLYIVHGAIHRRHVIVFVLQSQQPLNSCLLVMNTIVTWNRFIGIEWLFLFLSHLHSKNGAKKMCIGSTVANFQHKM